MAQETTLRLGNGYLIVEPAFPEILTQKLRYWHRKIEWSETRMRRIASGAYENLYQAETSMTPQGLYTQRLTTLPGFAFKVKNLLQEEGWTFKIVDERLPLPEPDFEAAMKGLRDYQVPIVYTAIMSGGGVVSAATGSGKTHLVASIIKAFPLKALQLRGTPQVVVTTPDKDITAKDYRDLMELMPDREVGLVMSGTRRFSDDVQVITLDSLHHLNPDDVGILIVDEVHAGASGSRADALMKFRRAARWGVSATPSGRFDGRDLVTEGIFGPVVSQYTFADGVRDGALVPIKVFWVKAPEPEMGLDHYNKYKKRESRYFHGVHRNTLLNTMIGSLMTRIPPNLQTLCIMQFLEHMNEIRPHCGDGVEIVHAEQDPKRFLKLKNLVPVSPKERRAIYGRMEAAEIRKILSTFVYKQGVNFPELSIVINAAGGGSEIVVKQIPGRESRKTESKTESFLVDFWHPWDKILDARGRMVPGAVHKDDRSREKVYEELGFEQTWVDTIDDLPFLKA